MRVPTTAFFLAPESRQASWGLAVSTLLGTFLLVSGSAMLNAYFEKDSDRFMLRTQDRPLAQKRFSARGVAGLGILCGMLGVPLLTFGANPLAGFLGALAYVVYVLLYTPLKSRTSFAALVGAVP